MLGRRRRRGRPVRGSLRRGHHGSSGAQQRRRGAAQGVYDLPRLNHQQQGHRRARQRQRAEHRQPHRTPGCGHGQPAPAHRVPRRACSRSRSALLRGRGGASPPGAAFMPSIARPARTAASQTVGQMLPTLSQERQVVLQRRRLLDLAGDLLRRLARHAVQLANPLLRRPRALVEPGDRVPPAPSGPAAAPPTPAPAARHAAASPAAGRSARPPAPNPTFPSWDLLPGAVIEPAFP